MAMAADEIETAAAGTNVPHLSTERLIADLWPHIPCMPEELQRSASTQGLVIVKHPVVTDFKSPRERALLLDIAKTSAHAWGSAELEHELTSDPLKGTALGIHVHESSTFVAPPGFMPVKQTICAQLRSYALSSW